MRDLLHVTELNGVVIAILVCVIVGQSLAILILVAVVQGMGKADLDSAVGWAKILKENTEQWQKLDREALDISERIISK